MKYSTAEQEVWSSRSSSGEYTERCLRKLIWNVCEQCFIEGVDGHTYKWYSRRDRCVKEGWGKRGTGDNQGG